MTGELDIDPYVSFNLKGLDKVNEAVDLLHAGPNGSLCLRAIVHINELKTNNQL